MERGGLRPRSVVLNGQAPTVCLASLMPSSCSVGTF